MLIPERFGCGLKLDFGELVSLRHDLARPFGADAAMIEGVRPETLSSIDRMFQVGVGPLDFCRLALRHATADLIASGAEPSFVSVSFEFGPELDAGGRGTLSGAFFMAARERRIQVGKCHSSTAPVTRSDPRSGRTCCRPIQGNARKRGDPPRGRARRS